LQAIKALEAGMTPSEVSEIIGSGTSTATNGRSVFLGFSRYGGHSYGHIL
jgi:alkylhydroperoxidase/carboxymuconolactone decarboxylase family protein YurZ